MDQETSSINICILLTITNYVDVANNNKRKILIPYITAIFFFLLIFELLNFIDLK